MGAPRGLCRALSFPTLHEVTDRQAGKPAPEVKGLSWDPPALWEQGSPGSPGP